MVVNIESVEVLICSTFSIFGSATTDQNDRGDLETQAHERERVNKHHTCPLALMSADEKVDSNTKMRFQKSIDWSELAAKRWNSAICMINEK